MLAVGIAIPIGADYRSASYANRSQLEEASAMRQDINIARRCERAVVTAYRELRQIGSDDLSAFQACTALYRIHHPEATLNEARRLVAEWVDHHLVRDQDGAPQAH